MTKYKGSNRQARGRGPSSTRVRRFSCPPKIGSKVRDQRVEPSERIPRLFETMRSGTPALRASAKKELLVMLPSRKKDLKNKRIKLCKGRTKQENFSREEAGTLNGLDQNLAKVEMQILSVKGHALSHPKMRKLAEKLRKLIVEAQNL